MKMLEPNIGAIKAVLVVATVLGLSCFMFHQGAAHVQTRWDAENSARAVAETQAVLTRVKNNERIAEQQAINNQRIEENHHAELAQVRADLARSPGLRVGAGVCAGFAATAQTDGAAGGAQPNPSGGLVREDVRRDLEALTLRVEEALATGRACQSFLNANSLVPAAAAPIDSPP